MSRELQIILDRLDQGQRAFILRMKPTLEDQRITPADWDDIDPCVDVGKDQYPSAYWFGRKCARWWPDTDGIDLSFRFNEVGLEVRAALTATVPHE